MQSFIRWISVYCCRIIIYPLFIAKRRRFIKNLLLFYHTLNLSTSLSRFCATSLFVTALLSISSIFPTNSDDDVATLLIPAVDSSIAQLRGLGREGEGKEPSRGMVSGQVPAPAAGDAGV